MHLYILNFNLSFKFNLISNQMGAGLISHTSDPSPGRYDLDDMNVRQGRFVFTPTRTKPILLSSLNLMIHTVAIEVWNSINWHHKILTVHIDSKLWIYLVLITVVILYVACYCYVVSNSVDVTSKTSQPRGIAQLALEHGLLSKVEGLELHYHTEATWDSPGSPWSL